MRVPAVGGNGADPYSRLAGVYDEIVVDGCHDRWAAHLHELTFKLHFLLENDGARIIGIVRDVSEEIDLGSDTDGERSRLQRLITELEVEGANA
jgi:hypothetical protein